jgi:hypothetical protein
MIIDVHAHMGERGFISEAWWEGMDIWVRENSLRTGASIEEAEKAAIDYMAALPDPTGEKLIQTMDDAGIDKTVIMPLDWGLVFGEPPVPIEEQNRQHAKLAEKYPDRVIAFAGVDPRRRGSLQLFERAVKEWGAKGLKLHPLSGFYPNDAALYFYYEKALELGVVVLIHIGQDPPPLRSKYGQPIYLNDVGVDFPDLPIIGAHMGGIWENDAVEVASMSPNIYLDLSLKQTWAFQSPMEFYPWLRRILDRLGPRKLMFGSDYPYLLQREDQKRWVKVFTEIPNSVGEAGIKFSKEEIDGILGNNAARVLRL